MATRAAVQGRWYDVDKIEGDEQQLKRDGVAGPDRQGQNAHQRIMAGRFQGDDAVQELVQEFVDLGRDGGGQESGQAAADRHGLPAVFFHQQQQGEQGHDQDEHDRAALPHPAGKGKDDQGQAHEQQQGEDIDQPFDDDGGEDGAGGDAGFFLGVLGADDFAQVGRQKGVGHVADCSARRTGRPAAAPAGSAPAGTASARLRSTRPRKMTARMGTEQPVIGTGEGPAHLAEVDLAKGQENEQQAERDAGEHFPVFPDGLFNFIRLPV